MATYYVDGKSGNDSNGGTNAKPWKTLAKANSKVSKGDTVLVRSAVYSEALVINMANTTWKADTGHTPILDGGYNESKKGKGIAGTLPGSKHTGLISLRAPGITIDGFTIRNVGGCGVNGTGCDGGTIRNCRIDWTYVSGIKISPGKVIEGFLIENNVCTRAGIQAFDATATGGKDPGGGVIKVGRTRNGIIRGNVCCMSYGEGINIGKGNLGFICEDNEIFLVSHKHIYVNRSQDITVRGNLVWYIPGYPEIDGGNPQAPGAIGIGDECGNKAGDPTSSCRNNDLYPKSKRVLIYNNLVVGLGELFFASNGVGNEGGGGYDTTLEDCYIGYNTFVAGPKTRSGIKLGPNQKGHPHVRTIFENNLIDWRFAPKTATLTVGKGDLQGIARRNNLWSTKPPAQFQGQNDQYGDPKLAKADAQITVSLNGSGPVTNFNESNYKLTANSTLAIDKGALTSSFNGLASPSITKDYFGTGRDNKRDIGAHEFNGQTITLEAGFGTTPDGQRGVVPHTVSFEDRSTAAKGIASWKWNFGDGQTSDKQHPSHTYTTPGSYTVSLTIKDKGGQENTSTQPNFIVAITEEEGEQIKPPADFRRFTLMAVEEEGEQAAAYGTQFPDLRCVLVWTDSPHHMSNYDSISDIEKVHGSNGKNYIVWIDPKPEEPEAVMPPTPTVVETDFQKIAEPV